MKNYQDLLLKVRGLYFNQQERYIVLTRIYKEVFENSELDKVSKLEKLHYLHGLCSDIFMVMLDLKSIDSYILQMMLGDVELSNKELILTVVKGKLTESHIRSLEEEVEKGRKARKLAEQRSIEGMIEKVEHTINSQPKVQ